MPPPGAKTCSSQSGNERRKKRAGNTWAMFYEKVLVGVKPDYTDLSHMFSRCVTAD